MRITLTGVAHVIISILVLAYSIAFRNIMAFSISLALTLIFYYEYKSFLEIRKAVESVVIRRALEKGVANELEDVGITITITNRSSTAIPYAILEDRIPRFVRLVESRPLFRFTLPPGHSITVEYKVKPLVPGVHDFKDVALHFLDALGYFNGTVSVECKASVTVLPLSASAGIGLGSIQRVIGIAVKGRALGGLYDLANIREYAIGDDARKILWKVYAKTGKLMVREDLGETFAKVLVLIDIRRHAWHIGIAPNTLAQVQLRLARSLIEFLAKNRCIIDIAICSGAIPKVVRNAEKDVAKAIYSVVSILPVEGGCDSPITVFGDSIKHLGRDYEFYDLVLLITNPISLAFEHNPIDVENLLKVFERRSIIVMPRYRYEDIVERELLSEFLKKVTSIAERAGSVVEMPESLYVV